MKRLIYMAAFAFWFSVPCLAHDPLPQNLGTITIVPNAFFDGEFDIMGPDWDRIGTIEPGIGSKEVPEWVIIPNGPTQIPDTGAPLVTDDRYDPPLW